MAFDVLIVDDQALVRHMVRTCVETHESLRVCGEAVTGVEAIELAVEHSPDAVILDNEMPEKTGIEALPTIRQALPDRVIVMYSSTQSPQAADSALAAGADAYLAKGQQTPAEVVAFVADRVSARRSSGS